MPTVFPSIPVERWPDQARKSWSASSATHGWSNRYRKRIARAYGRLLAHAARPDLADGEVTDAVNAFNTDVEATLKLSSAITYAEELVYALLILHPNVDWTPLQARNRDRRAALRKVGVRAHPGQTERCRRRAGEHWSADQRQRLEQSEVRVSDRLRQRAKSSQWTPRSKRQPGSERPDSPVAKSTATWSSARRTAVFATWDRYQRIAAERGLASIPTPESLDAFVKAVVGKNPNISDISLADYVGRIYAACLCLYPDQNWAWLKHDWRSMVQLAQASKDKRAQFVPIDELYYFGIQLMHRALNLPRTVKAAILYRDGLFIALIALRPKRISNIMTLKVGATLMTDAGGIPETITFAKTKNGSSSTTPYPSQHLGSYHSVWWRQFRPLLLGNSSDHGDVWIGKNGTAITASQLWRQMRKRTQPEKPVGLGKAIGVHVVRTNYATSMAEQAVNDPTLLRLVPWMLDQRDPRSIEPYNLHARGMAAASELQRACQPDRINRN